MARDPKTGQFAKPEPIPATYRRGNFVSSDPRAFDAMPPGEPPAILRARKPQPPISPADAYKARTTAIYLGIALALIVIAILIGVW